jgi:bacterioferritin-associated ferredoxin
MGRVEADAAASADEKKKLRREYEQKIEHVVQQMATLQQQMKQQVGVWVGCGLFLAGACSSAQLSARS